MWKSAALLVGSAMLALGGCADELQVVHAESQLEVDPVSIDFGDTPIGLQYRLELTLRNRGSVAIDLSTTLDEALGNEFALDEVPERIAGGGTHTTFLYFEPTSPGVRTGAIVFDTDSKTTPKVEVPVTGRGVEPALGADPPLIDFGRVVVGQTATTAVTLTNNGEEKLEVVRAVSEGSAEFSPALNRGFLEPTETLELVVTYTPIDVGPDEGRITIIDSAPRAQSLSIRVRGEGVDSDIEVEPLNLTFAGQYVGQTQTQPFIIRNIGSRDHQVTELVLVSTGALLAGEFEIDTSTASLVPFTVAPGEAHRIDVVYLPTDDQPDTDQVRIQSTGLSSPAVVTLSGSADLAPTPRIEVTPTSLNFGQVEIGQSGPLNLQITNVGNADLMLSSAIAIQPPTAPYALQNEPMNGTVFPPLDSSQFEVVFTPTVLGAAPAAEVIIQSDDPAVPTVRVPLAGEGINTSVPSIFVDPNPLDFGQVPRSVSASRTVLVRNDGSATLDVGLVRLTGDAGGRFRLPAPPSMGSLLAPTQQLTFAVEYFDNGVVATYNGMLEIQSNDPGGAVQVPLTAATQPPPPALTDISITLDWSRTGADIDLHLLRPGGSFFDRPSDCCYCNTNPDWGVAGQNPDNPFLDRDDLVGPGPENINLSVAENGEYEVVAHFFSDAVGAPADVTVEVKLRGAIVATRTQTMSNRERWIVGNIQWNAATQTGVWQAGLLGPFPTIFSICR